MKKALSLVLAVVLCLLLCACGGEEKNPQQEMTNGDNLSSDSTSTDSVSQDKEGLIIQIPGNGDVPVINAMRFEELVEKVELTTENWRDYIDVCSYNVETVCEDAFGEILSTETYTAYELGAKGDKYYNFHNFAIELKHKTTGDLLPDLFAVEGNVSLDDYECTRIKGTLYLVDIPEEVIMAYPDSGTRQYCVGYSDISCGPPEYLTLAGVGGRWCNVPSSLY